ncbi:MAG: sigma-54-dependent Fis family transcriptional regulator, partial [Chloroflexi bacterium]|nr:sigma-54-dependent Fis family transcriptional regulator [Chloroflexota bacterium]
KGRFELANKGTIFLDEVGELSLTAQRKLLRVLQEGEFERVGGTTTVKVDVRVVTATNRDLEEEVRKGNFREDLFYRLNVINIHMPPLRERKEDVSLLVEHFLDKYRYSPTSTPTRISEEALNKLIAYDWPGNVRQLENEIERAVVYTQGKVITSEFLSLEPGRAVHEIDIVEAVRSRTSLQTLLEEVERRMLSEALRQSGNDHAQAAERIGLSATAFDKKLKELGIR